MLWINGARLAAVVVVLAVLGAANVPDWVEDVTRSQAIATGQTSASEIAAAASKQARRAKYVIDGFAHAALLAVCLYLAQRARVRGWPLIVMTCATVYGTVHGVMQGACGYAAYFGGGGLRPPPGGLCERVDGWGAYVIAIAGAITLALIIEVKRADP